MNILNLDLDLMDSPECVGSKPDQQGTWLRLMAYCGRQENGGVIQACADWDDEDWLINVRVRLSILQSPARLWEWRDGALHVWGYPVDHETSKRARSESATAAARARWAKARASETFEPTKPSEDAYAHATAYADVHANASEIDANAMPKGKESKALPSEEPEKPKKNAKPEKPFRNVIPPKLEWVQAYASSRSVVPATEGQRFFDYHSSKGWKVGISPMKDWEAAYRTWEGNFKERSGSMNGHSNGSKHPALMTVIDRMKATSQFEPFERRSDQ